MWKCIFVLVEVETTKVEAVMKMKAVIELMANCALNVSQRSDKTRKQTITEIIGDHSLVHISLKVSSPLIFTKLLV